MATKKKLHDTKKQAPLAANTKQSVPRTLKKPTYKSFRLQKKIKPTSPKLPSSFKILKETVTFMFVHKKMFLKIGLLYGFITFFILGGIGEGLNIGEIKALLKEGLAGDFNNLGTSISLFGYLLGSSTNTASDVTRIYQTFTIITFSLALIWVIRQVKGNIPVPKIKEGFYKGMYPIVPFLLVFIVILLQFAPLLFGNFLYSTALSGDLIVSGAEKFVWYILFGLFVLLSFYMLTSSLFAMYIVTLPDMTPMRALKSARKLVQHRRFMVMRKILFLPIYMLVLSAIITLPVLIWLTRLAEPVFYLVTTLGLPFLHVYMYTLYRHLLAE